MSNYYEDELMEDPSGGDLKKAASRKGRVAEELYTLLLYLEKQRSIQINQKPKLLKKLEKIDGIVATREKEIKETKDVLLNNYQIDVDVIRTLKKL
jgi:hypothetical protein